MTFHDELDLLDGEQADAEAAADEAGLAGVDRRQFVFLSLATAAATTFGFGATALAQTPPAGGAAPQQTPPLPHSATASRSPSSSCRIRAARAR